VCRHSKIKNPRPIRNRGRPESNQPLLAPWDSQHQFARFNLAANPRGAQSRQQTTTIAGTLVNSFIASETNNRDFEGQLVFVLVSRVPESNQTSLAVSLAHLPISPREQLKAFQSCGKTSAGEFATFESS